MIKSNSNNHKGFTLIEVLVALSIFTVVVTISVSVLYALIDANARSRNTQSIATNISFMLDSMTREIRTGTDYYCVTDISDPMPTGVNDFSTQDCDTARGAALSFNEGGRSLTGNTANGSQRIAYRLLDGKIQRRLGNGDNIGGENEAADWLDLTSDDITIENLRFHVEGTTPADDIPPFVTVFMNGTVGDEAANQGEFSVQTTITARLLDI